ncbi:hypothetical protein L1049_021061 [Liquidambar formosana]|uniref:RING-type E3 ubiquitin transferase n=1 Tax=Liquidambar formosana TaxID=63359 RepID=A0AAP0X7X8_LIQFO
MGLSWSKIRRHNHRHHNHHHHHNQTPTLPQPAPPAAAPPAPPPEPPAAPPSAPPAAALPSSHPPNPFPSSSSIPPTLPIPRPPPASFAFAANAPYPTPPQPYTHHPYPCNPTNFPPLPFMGNYPSFFPNQSTGWGAGFRPVAPTPPAVPYVDHQSAKKIKNDVNVHKDSIRVELDEKNLDSHLVSFTFDAMVDGSITIFYFAKEGANCTFTPSYPEICMPVRIPFQKGLGQKFFQPSGTGIDLGFFDMDELSKPSPIEDVFPLVISAETCLPSLQMDEQVAQLLPTASPHAQITQAVLQRNSDGHFQVRVVKQILWVDGVRYELREIYGIGNSDEAGFDDSEPGKECVICMTEPKDTAVLPCRHLCMCSECAKELRLQSNKCPICRQPIQQLIEIKVNKEAGGLAG